MTNDSIQNMQAAQDPMGTSAMSPGGEGFLQDSLFHMLWRQSWIVLAVAVLAVIAALVYLAKATPIFTSTSRVYVEQTGPRIMKDMEEGVMTASKNYLYTQAELLRATPVVSEAIDKCGAKRLRAFADVDNPIEFLKRALDAQVGKKDDIISVSFKSPYPLENAQVVNAVVDAYVTFSAGRKKSTSAEVLKLLQKEKTTREQQLTERLRALTEFKENNEALAFQTERGGNMILERFDRLSTVLTEAQLATLETKSTYESAKAMVEDPAGLEQFVQAYMARSQGGLERNEASQLRARLRDLRQLRADREQLVTKDHPGFQAVDVEIQKIEADLAASDRQFAEAQLAFLKQEYLAAKEKEDQLTARYEEQHNQAAGLNKLVSQYALLQSEYEQSKKLNDILDDRIRELNVTEDAGAMNITILEAARPSTSPSEPQKTKIMAMALFLGLMAGAGLGLAREMLDHRLHSSDEVTALVGQPLLSVVPAMSKKESVSQRGMKVAMDSKSPIAETFRTIRTAVFFSVPYDRSRVIHITSAMATEGKSTLVSNLAIAMAQSGQKVLIIDADLRRPTQHQIFQAGRDGGLSSVLAGMQKLAAAIKKTSVPGLDLLPAGPETPNPAEMLGSKTFEVLLAKVSQHYDRVLLDSPPVGPVSDACILAAQGHTTILVVRAGVCTRHALVHARDSLIAVGGHIIGVVVNGVSKGKSWYGYGYYDKYRYEYGYREGSNGKRKGGGAGKSEPSADVLADGLTLPGEAGAGTDVPGGAETDRPDTLRTRATG
jgi:capsular exopolysaccharide synthesis family protein